MVAVRKPAWCVYPALFWPLAAVWLGDSLLKRYVEANWPYGAQLPAWPNVLAFRFVENKGVAFSLFSQVAPFALLAVNGLFIVGLLGWALQPKPMPLLQRLSLGLIIGGALCNWVDRLLDGGVTDYLEPLFVRFPIFNLSDIAISVGAALLVYVWSFRNADSPA